MKHNDVLHALKGITRILGFGLLFISVFFSYDGFDQSINGGNDGYSFLAIAIGFTLAVTCTVLEFIFNTDFSQLNWTLRLAGLIAYAYSIWTNFLGIQHILGSDKITSWVVALFMDAVPEPMIAWSFGEGLTGDMVGNFIKTLFGEKPNSPNPKPFHVGEHHPQQTPRFPNASQKPEQKAEIPPWMQNIPKDPTYHSMKSGNPRKEHNGR